MARTQRTPNRKSLLFEKFWGLPGFIYCANETVSGLPECSVELQ